MVENPQNVDIVCFHFGMTANNMILVKEKKLTLGVQQRLLKTELISVELMLMENVTKKSAQK